MTESGIYLKIITICIELIVDTCTLGYSAPEITRFVMALRIPYGSEAGIIPVNRVWGSNLTASYHRIETLPLSYPITPENIILGLIHIRTLRLSKITSNSSSVAGNFFSKKLYIPFPTI